MIKVIKLSYNSQRVLANFIREKSTFNWEQLLSEESKINCIKNLNKEQQIKLTKKEPEKHAAVLIPLVQNKDGSLSILYNLRSTKLSKHVRQVSFPGGSKDDSDKDFIDCALRETEEEIGIPRSQIDVWGTGQLLISYVDPAIMPVIGLIKNYDPTKLIINHHEVEKVFTVPIEHLCSEKAKSHTQFRSGYTIPVYLGGEEKIWGITAVLTYQFLNSFLPKNLCQHNIKFISNYKTLS